MKKCKDCRQLFPATTQYFYENRPGMLSGPCKACYKERTRQYRRMKEMAGLCHSCNSPVKPGYRRCEYHLQYGKFTNAPIGPPRANKPSLPRHPRDLRLIIIHGYGGKCSCCGEAERKFLCIDHVNNNGGQERRQGKKSSTLYKFIISNEFPEDYQLLCYNCNGAKAVYGQCPHQE